MSLIAVEHLKKYYNVAQKKPGLIGSFSALFSRTYDTVKAVDDVSFEIDEGELVGFIGPNGAGKTTTLKTLSGLLYPTSGSVSVLGFRPHERKTQYLKKLSFISGQKSQLWWDLPPIETFLLNKEIYEVPEKRYQETINNLIELLDITDIIHTPTKKLSLGQRMKCELAAALIHTPKVLYLDEPTIGLDVVMQKTMRDFIKEYNQQYNATVMLTSHYMQDVKELCKRVIIIDNGHILFDGQLDEITARFDKMKTLTFTSLQKIPRDELKEFGTITTAHYPEYTLEIKREDISQITAKLLKKLNISDLTIEDSPIEDIIREIFSNTHETV